MAPAPRRERGLAVLRALLAVLVVANVLFFAFTRGSLDGFLGLRSLGDREPERLVEPGAAADDPAAAGRAPRRALRSRLA